MRKSPFFCKIASLDGVAIRFEQTKLDEVEDPPKYYNGKMFYAECDQAATTADYRFCFLSAKFASSTHYSTAFKASIIYNLLRNEILPSWAYIFAESISMTVLL